MKHIHRQEKQQFKKLFKQEYIDVFEDRFNILEVFLQTEKHLTIDELIKLLEENGYNFEPDFIMDTLKLMVRFGFAKKTDSIMDMSVMSTCTLASTMII